MEYMFRTLLFLIVFILGLILILPVGLILKLFYPKDKFAPVPAAAEFIAAKIIPFITKIGGCNYTIIGQENIPEGPALFVGNHQGDFDVLLILFAFKRIPIIVAKMEAAKVPIAHMWMTLMHTIFMDRKDLRQSLRCIKDAEEYLEHGFKVVLFPEGTRSQGPDMGEFKAGAFKTAVKTKTPIVPFVIDGTYKVFEKQKYLKKSDCSFIILNPIYTDGTEKTQEIADEVKSKIQSKLDEIRAEKHE